MAGSKKGERRGNARKRPEGPGGPRTASGHRQKQQRRTHESVGEIMEDAVRRGEHNHTMPVTIERRIQVARVINGPSDDIRDITPKEAMLQGMRFHLQAIRDTEQMLHAIATAQVDERSTAGSNALLVELERLHDKAGDFAFKVAGYVHPKYQAQVTVPLTGQNQMNVVQALLDEIDEMERNRPIPIEHKQTKTGGG